MSRLSTYGAVVAAAVGDCLVHAAAHVYMHVQICLMWKRAGPTCWSYLAYTLLVLHAGPTCWSYMLVLFGLYAAGPM